jgi:hypothetical protein
MNNTEVRPKTLRPQKFRRLSIGLVFSGFLLLAFQGLVSDYTRAAFAADGIYIPQAKHRFENNKGGEASHTFRIYNVRPRRLAVEAQPDCGCTGISWTRATIAPFGWKELTAKIESRGVSRAKSSVSIGLHTDSVARPWLFMFLEG